MKILFITNRFLPEIGGVERHVAEVTKCLQKMGNEISIITRTENTHYMKTEINDEYIIFRKIVKRRSSRNYLYKLFYNLIKLKIEMAIYLISKYRFILKHDVIHLHDFETLLWILPLMPFIKKRLFITFHGFEGFPVKRPYFFLRKFAEKQTRGNICMGSFITKWYKTKANFVSVGGVDTSIFPLSDYQDDAFLFVGRLERDTNILEFLNCLYILKTKYNIDKSITICGDGTLRSTIMNFSKEHDIKLTMYGFVSNPLPFVLHHRFVYATGYLSILESMISKKLVFALYDNPLKKDYLFSIPSAENKMLISGSSDHLAFLIAQHIRDPTLTNKIVEEAYAFAKDQSWTELSKKYLKLWNKNGKEN